MRDYPIDIFSISDIEKWNLDFFWPISQKYVEAMAESLFLELRSFIRNNNDEILTHLLHVQISFFFSHFFNILHAVKLIDELNKNDYNILYNQNYNIDTIFSINKHIYKEIIKNGSPDISNIPVHWGHNNNNNNNNNNNIKLFLKKWLKFTKGEFHWKWRRLSYGNEIPVVFNPNQSLLDYIKHKNKEVIFSTQEQWLIGLKKISLTKENYAMLNRASSTLKNTIKKIAINYDIQCNDKLYAYIEKYSYLNLEYTFILFNHLIKHKKLSLPINLWAGRNGNFITRILSEAVRFKGGIVSHFPHSGGVSRFKKVQYINVLLTTGDYFGVYSQNEIPLFEKLIERFPLLQKKIGFFKIFSNEYKDLYKLNKTKPLPKQIKEIVYVPTSYQGDNRLIYHPPDLVHLDWEFRLIKFLVSAGYKVTYKNHPKGLMKKEKFEIFGKNVKYVYEPFQEIMDFGDAFIFDIAPSTAMYEAMCTKKKIVFIYYGVPESYHEPFALLAKRCRIVSAKLDEKNRIIVDEKELISALSPPIDEPNYEYLNKYLW